MKNVGNSSPPIKKSSKNPGGRTAKGDICNGDFSKIDNVVYLLGWVYLKIPYGKEGIMNDK